MGRLIPLLAVALVAAAAHGEGKVYPSAEAVEPLEVGASVPAVVLRDVRGHPFDLAGAVRESGALLVFYRGGW